MLTTLRKTGWASALTHTLSYLAALPTATSLFSSPASASDASPSWASSIESELGPLLAPSAQILLPSSPDFPTYNERWSETGRPTYAVIITVTNENDVSAAVKYANKHDIPFLATTGAHGTWHGLDKLQNGMAIYMRGINHFDLSLDGKSVTFGGGVRGTDVVNNLWAVGKQTVSGACTCVSVAGPALGGGHGFLQGQYGLLADQIIGARAVLADGEVVVATEDENADLLWALKGAGHNFGIVTEFQYRVYDAVKPDWAYEFLFFSGDKVEELYEVHNEMMEYQPAEAVQWSVWRMDPEVDPVNPIISLFVFHNGGMEALVEYTEKLHNVGPYHSFSGITPYVNLSRVAGFDLDGAVCQHLNSVSVFPADVEKFDIPAMRAWFNEFSNMLSEEPALQGSFCLVEGYSTQAVRAIPQESTAFPHRNKNLLLAPLITHSVLGNKTLDDIAFAWGERQRNVIYPDASTRHSYVNYAAGSETVEQLYGFEEWRVEKLKALKEKYDPKGRFGWFAPIIRDSELEDEL